MNQTKPIAQTNNFIILNIYNKIEQQGSSYQSEADLEKKQYEYYHDLLLNFPKPKEEV